MVDLFARREINNLWKGLFALFHSHPETNYLYFKGKS